MITSKKRRKVLLAISGLLLGATCYGWAQQAGWLNPAKPQQKPAPIASAPSTALPSAIKVEKSVVRKVVQPIVVRLSGRPDPVSPVVTREQPTKIAAQFHPARRGFALPPPPDPSSYPNDRSSAVEMTQLHRAHEEFRQVPLSDIVRLSGLLDGKAIFTLPAEVATAKHLDRSFTLGVGQKYSDLILDSITESSATVRHGKAVSVKQLAPVN